MLRDVKNAVLRDVTFARGCLMAAMDDGGPLQLALCEVIRAAGVPVVARRAGMPASDVQRALRPGHGRSQITLDSMPTAGSA